MTQQGTNPSLGEQTTAQAPSMAIRMAILLVTLVIGFTALMFAAFLAVTQGDLAKHAIGAIIMGGMVYASVVLLIVIPAVIKLATLDLGDKGYSITPESLFVSERRFVRRWPWLTPQTRAVPLRDIQGVHAKHDFWDRTCGCGSVHVDTSNGDVLKVGPIRNPTEFAERLLHEVLVTADYTSREDYELST